LKLERLGMMMTTKVTLAQSSTGQTKRTFHFPRKGYSFRKFLWPSKGAVVGESGVCCLLEDVRPSG
jgi:hypothetical protein